MLTLKKPTLLLLASILLSALAVFMTACTGDEEPAAADTGGVKPGIDPNALVASLAQEARDCAIDAYEPDELGHSVGLHILLIEQDDEELLLKTPLGRYFECFPLTDQGASDAMDGIQKALHRSFLDDSVPPFVMLGMPEDTATNFFMMRAFPPVSDGLYLQFGDTERDLRYVAEVGMPPEIVFQMISTDEQSGLITEDLLANWLFLVPRDVNRLDLSRMTAGRTDGLVWAYMPHDDGSDFPGESLVWGNEGGNFLWRMWVAPGQSVESFQEVVKLVASQLFEDPDASTP